MLFKTLILAAALAAPALAVAAAEPGYTVPTDITEGTYSVYRDESGQEIHTRLDSTNTPVRSVKFAAALKTRADIPTGTVSCISDQNFPQSDIDAANAGLDSQCGGWKATPQYNSKIYSVSGNVVAYHCEYDGDGDGCSDGVRVQRTQEIVAKCGAGTAGYSTVKTVSWLYYYGEHDSYGYQSKNDKFCGF